MTSLSYPYPSLDATKSQIRLLEIHPQPDSSLQYSLRTFDIKNCPPYIALSYTWGDDEPANTIVINGQAFKIRNNLSYALPRLASLRRGDKPEFLRDETYFWIDAICIDQGDTEERNHQVAIMADIFTTAALTVAWLGPEDENFQTLTNLIPHHLGLDHLDNPVSPESRLLAKSFLEKIASKEYFTRMWIIQEIVLSQEVWVICGSRICAWQTLEKYWMGDLDLPGTFLPYTWEIQSAIRHISNGATISPLDPLHSAMTSRFMHNDPQAVRLDHLVHIHFDRKCRDPRDRIYALLGLLPPQVLQSNPIPVDYNISLEALFVLVRKHFHLHKPALITDNPRVTQPENDWARNLQKALGLDTAFRLQCESHLIEEGFFRDTNRGYQVQTLRAARFRRLNPDS